MTIDDLKQRFSFDEWGERSDRGDDLAVRGFTFEGNELPSWKLESVRTFDFEKGRGGIRSIWSTEDQQEDEERLINIDVYECESLADAHEQLIELLGEFQSPDIERSQPPVAGDVAFRLGNTMVLFARGNLTVLVRNAGRPVVEVLEFAAMVDQRVMSAGQSR